MGWRRAEGRDQGRQGSVLRKECGPRSWHASQPGGGEGGLGVPHSPALLTRPGLTSACLGHSGLGEQPRRLLPGARLLPTCHVLARLRGAAGSGCGGTFSVGGTTVPASDTHRASASDPDNAEAEASRRTNGIELPAHPHLRPAFPSAAPLPAPPAAPEGEAGAEKARKDSDPEPQAGAQRGFRCSQVHREKPNTCLTH